MGFSLARQVGPSAGSEGEKGWAGLGCCWVLGWGDGLSLGFFSNSSSLLFLIQTKFEFKYNLNSNTI